MKKLKIFISSIIITSSTLQGLNYNINKENCFNDFVENFINTEFDKDGEIDQESKNNLLMNAIENDNLEAARLLISYGADVNAITVKNNTKTCAVLLALSKPEILNFLIKSNANLNIKLSQKRTPLHFAVQNIDNEEIIYTLLENGANINDLDLYGNTPLHLSIGYKKNMLILLEYGADINIINHEGKKALHQIYQTYDIDLLKCFVKRGASLKEFNSEGQNALHIACHSAAYSYSSVYNKNHKMNLLRFLIEEQKMDINQYGLWYDGKSGSFTPFMLAIAAQTFLEDDFEILEYLLAQGANMNTQVYQTLHGGRRHVLYNSVLSWVTETKQPRYIVEWLIENSKK